MHNVVLKFCDPHVAGAVRLQKSPLGIAVIGGAQGDITEGVGKSLSLKTEREMNRMKKLMSARNTRKQVV